MALDPGDEDRSARQAKHELQEKTLLNSTQALITALEQACRDSDAAGTLPSEPTDPAALDAIRYRVELARARYEMAAAAVRITVEQDRYHEQQRAEDAQGLVLKAQADAMAETNRIYRGMFCLTIVIAFGTLVQAVLGACQLAK